MPVDWDGKIRMDCSSPYAMARLTDLKDRFDVAFANDPDADRHGIVTPSAGLLNPNHHLAACISYLFGGADVQRGARACDQRGRLPLPQLAGHRRPALPGS